MTLLVMAYTVHLRSFSSCSLLLLLVQGEAGGVVWNFAKAKSRSSMLKCTKCNEPGATVRRQLYMNTREFVWQSSSSYSFFFLEGGFFLFGSLSSEVCYRIVGLDFVLPFALNFLGRWGVARRIAKPTFTFPVLTPRAPFSCRIFGSFVRCTGKPRE